MTFRNLALACFLMTVVGPSAGHGAPDLTSEQALQILSSTDTFADLFVGFAGGPSPQACAFRTVLDQPDADRLFKRILVKASLAGRLYALCGLYFTDHEQFLHEIQPYRRSADSVATFQGCLMGRQDVASLVELGDRGEPKVVRLREPTETIAEWLERTRDSASQDYRLDIVGGGWPARFRELKRCDR